MSTEPEPLDLLGALQRSVQRHHADKRPGSAKEQEDPPRPRAAIRTPMTADELAEIRDYRDRLAQNGILNASAYRLTALLNEIDRLRNQS